MKKYIKIILPAIFASLGFAACSDHDTDGNHVNATDNSGRELICFSSEATPMTRLPLTDHGFDEPTQIKMLFKAEHNSSAQVPSWAIATATMQEKDLTYSNNISEGGQYGRHIQTYTSDWYTTLGHGQLQWNAKEVGETTGKYDQGHLIFQHALAKLEINLKEGADFNNNSGDDFKWTNGSTTVEQNIQLNGLNTSGTFDASNGSWSGATQTNITQMYESNVTTGTQTTRTVVAYIVPGNNLYETTSNVITFCIDYGQYYVTGQQIANAIREYYSTDAEAKNTNCTFSFEDRGTRLIESQCT